MPLQQDFEKEHGVCLLEHRLRLSALERIGNADEGLGERLFANVIEEAYVVVQHDRRGRQRLEQSVDVMRVALQTCPMSDVVLPPGSEKHSGQHLAADRVVVIKPGDPLRALDAVRKELPEGA